MKKITIIDDEINICKSVQFAIKQAGYNCDYYTDPSLGILAIEKNLPDLIILDIIMPGIDGLALCRRIRNISETIPVIFLSSKDEEFDRVLGLEMGADDYLCKPFSMKELIARTKVNFRRSEYLNSNIQEPNAVIVHCGPLEINHDAYLIRYFGHPLSLTVTEFRILYALVEEAGKVKTRDQLLTKAFPSDYFVSDRTIDTHIKRIRKKLTHINSDHEPIKTVFGVGYKYLKQ